MKIAIIAGSRSDEDHVQKIIDGLKFGVAEENIKTHFYSAHKNTPELLELLKRYNQEEKVIFITVAGMSNALSGVVAGNTNHVVIACPPFESVAAYAVDIHSTLRMPSNLPILTVLSPSNCALAVKRIIGVMK